VALTVDVHDALTTEPDGRVVLDTERLILRELCERDAAFIVELLNQPSFLEHIGDRGVRDQADARRYIADGPVASYRANGFGLFRVEERKTAAVAGMCGLMRKPWLDAPDLAYALLPAFWSRGYAGEAAAAVLAAARERWGVIRVTAVVAPANASSLRLLDRLGFRFEQALLDPHGTTVQLLAHAPAGEEPSSAVEPPAAQEAVEGP
jgi:[ribosomal protein S5]-alanine N-acetyltransferase